MTLSTLLDNRLTYIASGVGYTGLTFSECLDDNDLNAWIHIQLAKMQTDPSHNFGLLYNAWQEKGFGAAILPFKKNLALIESDSGGLQAITQGKVFNDNDKEKIYKNQGTYSDFAMSFDEIPLKFSGGKSTRLDLSNRWYTEDMLEPSARLTGKNIKNQIECFIKNKSKTKPVFIMQGNCYDSYMRWADYALDEIPKEFHEFIGGVAMGAAALGHGSLEDIKRAFIYTQLPDVLLKPNHLHLLAVGSVSRLIPNLIFMKSGLYKNLHLTYDSTTHTSGIQMGRYYVNNNNLLFTRNHDVVIWDQIFESCRRFGLDDFDSKKFYNALNCSSTKVYEETFGSRNDVIKCRLAATFGSISNFTSHVNECLTNDASMWQLAGKRDMINAFRNLLVVKNLDDFNYWERNVGKYVTSKPVPNTQPTSLEDFF